MINKFILIVLIIYCIIFISAILLKDIKFIFFSAAGILATWFVIRSESRK